MTPDKFPDLAAQSRVAVAEADDALLAARSACMLAVLQHKLPAKVLTSAVLISIFPDLMSRARRSEGLAGISVECDNGVPARTHVVHLEGAGVDALRLPGGLVLIATGSSIAQAMLAGGALGASIPVAAGPLREPTLLDAGCVMCWFFSAGDLCAAIVADAAMRFDHTPSALNRSSLVNALSAAVCKAQRRLAANTSD